MTGPAQMPATGRPATSAVLETIVGFRLRRLQTLWIAHWTRGIRRSGLEITPMQGGTMMLIDENPGIGHSALAGLLQVEAPTLSQTLTPLVEGGLVNRSRASGDRRAVALRLSRSGAKAVAGIAEFSRVHETELLATFDQQDRRDLERLLDKALASAAAANSAEKFQD